jgi:phospholipase/lecithinase/hemolysin
MIIRYKMSHRFFVLFAIMFSLFCSHSFAGEGTPFNKIVFLGDSLSDNGNLYNKDWGYLPKSPPYYEGRFTNGYVWSEYATKYFYDQNYISSENYAVGGETTVFHNPWSGFLPWTLGDSLTSYYAHSFWTDRSTTLFVIWIGANDYLPGSTDVEGLTTSVTDTIRDDIISLINSGANNFLIINLPNLSVIPYAAQKHMEENLRDLSLTHNAKLAEKVNIHLFDLNALFTDVLTHPDEYNKKYNVHITNTTDACWEGGFSLRNNQFGNAVNENNIAAAFSQYLQAQAKLHPTKLGANKIDTAGMAHAIVTNPQLMEAYQTTLRAEEGQKPCANPDNYLYWDHVHPTAIVHKLLFEEIKQFMFQHYTLAK